MATRKKDPTVKGTPGRIKRSKLYDRPIQNLMLRRVIQTGVEAGCWEGVTSRRNYYDWKKRNREAWEGRVNKAIAQHLNHAILADPNLKKMVIKALVDKIKEGKLNAAELLKVLQFLPDIME